MDYRNGNKKVTQSFLDINYLIIFSILALFLGLLLVIKNINQNQQKLGNEKKSSSKNLEIPKNEITTISVKKDLTIAKLPPKSYSNESSISTINILSPTLAQDQINQNNEDRLNYDWLTYIDKDYKFKIKYHPTLSITETYDDQGLQFNNPLKIIRFGTGEKGYNYLKSPYGFEITVANQFSEDVFIAKTVGHITDKIDSVENVSFNNIVWKKFNYQVFMTTDYINQTTAVATLNNFAVMINSLSSNIDVILSNFYLMD